MQTAKSSDYRNAVADSIIKARENLRAHRDTLQLHGTALVTHAATLVTHATTLGTHATTLGTHTGQITGLTTDSNMNPAGCSDQYGDHFLFHIGTDYCVYRNFYNTTNGWSGWAKIGDTDGDPIVMSSGLMAYYDASNSTVHIVGRAPTTHNLVHCYRAAGETYNWIYENLGSAAGGIK